MNNNQKKYITCCIGVLIGVYGAVINPTSLKAQTESSNIKDDIVINNYKELLQNKNWVKIHTFWKEMSALELQRDYDRDYGNFKELYDKKNNITINISLLRDSKLLTKKQSKYLNDLIYNRLSYLEYHIGFVECYKMTLLGSKVAQTKGDLEKRYETLEKLFKEDKIDQKTFELTKNKIVEDLKFIDENSNLDPKPQLDDYMTDLIILLNK